MTQNIWKPVTKSDKPAKVELYNMPLESYYDIIDYGELAEQIKVTYPDGGVVYLDKIVRCHIIGRNKKLLKKRLLEAKAMLDKSVKKLFINAKFDFESKRLIGDNGYYLEYTINRNLPESYNNQLISTGSVMLCRDKS